MKIWILNHYATDMYFDGGGRHQSLAKYLIKLGHDVKIFCANTVHNSSSIVDTEGNLCVEKIGKDEVPYIFIKTRPYQGNGKSRILNMIDYYKGVNKVLHMYVKQYGAPDIFYASSVHPLALIAGIKAKKKYGGMSICEVRDLWPETLVELGKIDGQSVFAKLMYCGEKWIYKKADKIIFTMQGGRDYVQKKGWSKWIPESKIFYLNNGVDLEEFTLFKKKYELVDPDLTDADIFKVIYAGSIREVNGVEKLLDVGIELRRRHIKDIKVLIYGDGTLKEELESRAKRENIDDIILFKGRVDKKYIPYVVSQADLNIVVGKKSNIARYGVSWNKLFEYIAARKPIVADFDLGKYNLIEKEHLGKAKKFSSITALVDIILAIRNKAESESNFSEEAIQCIAEKYDYKFLAEELLKIIEG